MKTETMTAWCSAAIIPVNYGRPGMQDPASMEMQMPDLVFTDNNMEYEIPAAPHQTISLEFSCNFYVKDAKERRGEDRLSMIVSMEEK